MHRIKNLFPEIYDFENLFCAYKDGIRQKRDRPDIMTYTANLEENLITLQNELIWKTYKVGPYRSLRRWPTCKVGSSRPKGNRRNTTT